MKNIDILTLARYVITRSYTDNPNDWVSNYRLNVILYYIQVYLVKNNLDTIGAHLEAWRHFPVFPTVYYKYRGFGYAYVSNFGDNVYSLDLGGTKICSTHAGYKCIYNSYIVNINNVIDECLKLSLSELGEKVRSPEGAWYRVRQKWLSELSEKVRSLESAWCSVRQKWSHNTDNPFTDNPCIPISMLKEDNTLI